MDLIASLLRVLPASLLHRVGWKCLRVSSGSFRAWSELFIEPYHRWVPWHSGLGDSTMLLYALVRGLKPKTIVEIGSARGRSTCAMALACKENGFGRVVAIDPHNSNSWNDHNTRTMSTETFLRERLAEYGLTALVDVRVATSPEVARNWNEPIDLLFIDGDHSFAGVRHDFVAFQSFLTKHALVVFHDTAWDHEQPWAIHREQMKLQHPEDMGVPTLMDMLQRQGYHSITFPTLPGLTILDPNVGGFGFLAGHTAGSPRAERDSAERGRLSLVHDAHAPSEELKPVR